MKEHTYISKTREILKIITHLQTTPSISEDLEEQYWSVGLDSNDKIRFIELIPPFYLYNKSHYKELLHSPLQKSTQNLILIHYKQNRELAPVNNDKTLAQNLFELYNLINSQLYDYITMNQRSYYSFKENQLIKKIEIINHLKIRDIARF